MVKAKQSTDEAFTTLKWDAIAHVISAHALVENVFFHPLDNIVRPFYVMASNVFFSFFLSIITLNVTGG